MPCAVVTGAAGFIGSHLCDRLLAEGYSVCGIDNLLRGRQENLRSACSHTSFHFIESDLSTEDGALAAFEAASQRGSVEFVWHMASNSDVVAGTEDPTIDLRHTFLTTFHVLGAMRRFGISEIAFASSSSVYGAHQAALAEDTGPLFPISNYGAMKLASEAAITAAVDAFLARAYLFRFPNVVGARATHGIIFDLIGKLRRSSAELAVLGDGTQQKPYLHVSELIDAMMLIVEKSRERINCFNISADDEGCSVRYIAETVVRMIAPGTPIRYGDSNRGWPGDVPRFRYAIDKLFSLGWRPKSSSEQAVERAVREIAEGFCACKS